MGEDGRGKSGYERGRHARSSHGGVPRTRVGGIDSHSRSRDVDFRSVIGEARLLERRIHGRDGKRVRTSRGNLFGNVGIFVSGRDDRKHALGFCVRNGLANRIVLGISGTSKAHVDDLYAVVGSVVDGVDDGVRRSVPLGGEHLHRHDGGARVRSEHPFAVYRSADDSRHVGSVPMVVVGIRSTRVEVVAAHVVDVTVLIVVDAVSGDFADIDEDVRFQIGMRERHARVDNAHLHLRLEGESVLVVLRADFRDAPHRRKGFALQVRTGRYRAFDYERLHDFNPFDKRLGNHAGFEGRSDEFGIPSRRRKREFVGTFAALLGNRSRLNVPEKRKRFDESFMGERRSDDDAVRRILFHRGDQSGQSALTAGFDDGIHGNVLRQIRLPYRIQADFQKVVPESFGNSPVSERGRFVQESPQFFSVSPRTNRGFVIGEHLVERGIAREVRGFPRADLGNGGRERAQWCGNQEESGENAGENSKRGHVGK